MKFKLLVFFWFVLFNTFAQTEDAWVYFADKPDETYFMANPLEMLSQKALDRRTTHNIVLETNDIPISQSYISQISNAPGVTIMAKSKWLNALHVRGSFTDLQALTTLSFVTEVRFANHSLNLRMVNNSQTEKTTTFQNKWDVSVMYNYGGASNQVQMLNAHLLHQQDYTGSGKTVAVLDSGFIGVNTAQSFQNLFANNLILGGYNFPDRNTNFYTRHNHGTNVLSTMGGYVDNQLVGTAPNAAYYLFITEDVNSENPVEESYWVEAAEMADSLGVDIINSSLGYGQYDNPNYSYNYAQRNGQVGFASRGASIAFSKGIVCVLSAGNSGATSEPHVGIPADATNVLTVGAVTSTESYASFSSIGPTSDTRIKPDVAALGVAATISDTSGNITAASGTSFSSPILAGAIASFWSAVPSLTAAEVIQYVKESADQFQNPDNFKGYGVPDFQLALMNALNIESFEKSQLTLYPNPVQDNLYLNLPHNTTGSFVLYDLLGKKILETTLNQDNTILTLSELHSGVYLYDFSTNNSKLRGKIIKQ